MAQLQLVCIRGVGKDPDVGRDSYGLRADAVDVDTQSTADIVPVLPEDLVPESDDAKIEELAAAPAAAAAVPEPEVAEAVKEEAAGGTDWNNTPANGWTSAEAPAGAENGAAAAKPEPDAKPESESGVLGSAPPAAPAVVEKGPMQVYNYYMVKVPRPVDKQGKTDISSAEQQLQDKTDARDAHNRIVQAARVKRNEAYDKWKAARQVERDCLNLVKKKYEEIKPLRESLKKMKEAGRAVQQKSREMPTSEEELDRRIGALEWTIQHESIPLKEEKQLMRDIKALQSSRETVRANAAMFAQVHECLGQRKDLESALKPLEAEYKQLDLELKNAAKVTEQADKEFEVVEAALNAVQEKLQLANDKRNEAYVLKRSLKDQEYLKMTDFYNNKREIQEAKLMAIQPNNRKAVEDYCSAQVDRVLEMWNTNAEFRKNYVKDNEWSTARRLGGLDGRSLGPDEARPILSSQGDGGHSAGFGAQQNGARGGASVKESAPAKSEVVREVIKEVVAEEKPMPKRESARAAAAAASPVVVEPVKSKEVLEKEAADMKEQRRVVEMAKAKEAEDRKKRMAERAEAKAKVRELKEAEKREKEKEKKARKKAMAVTPTESDGLSDSTPAADTAESVVPEPQEAVPEEVKVSSRQRKRGLTNVQKQAAKLARATGPTPPLRAKKQKYFGLSLPVLLAAGVGVAILLLVVYFLVSRGSVQEGARV